MTITAKPQPCYICKQEFIPRRNHEHATCHDPECQRVRKNQIAVMHKQAKRIKRARISGYERVPGHYRSQGLADLEMPVLPPPKPRPSDPTTCYICNRVRQNQEGWVENDETGIVLCPRCQE